MSTRANLSPSHLFPQAWQTFKRRPWISVGMWIVYVMFSGQGGGGGGQSMSEGDLGPEEWIRLRTVLLGLLALVLVVIMLAGPIRGGYDMAMLRLIRGDDSVSFRDLFAGFSKFRKLFLTVLIYYLGVLGGMLLLIVPGIILLIALWPAFLLVMEDDLGPVEAIKGAWALTHGHKKELFLLGLAAFIVLIAGFLALGIGLLVAGPVIQLARIGAYHEMRKSTELAIASAAYPQRLI